MKPRSHDLFALEVYIPEDLKKGLWKKRKANGMSVRAPTVT